MLDGGANRVYTRSPGLLVGQQLDQSARTATGRSSASRGADTGTCLGSTKQSRLVYHSEIPRSQDRHSGLGGRSTLGAYRYQGQDPMRTRLLVSARRLVAFI